MSMWRCNISAVELWWRLGLNCWRSPRGDSASSGHTQSHLTRWRWWIGGDPRCLRASEPPPTKLETPDGQCVKGVGGDGMIPLYRCLQEGPPVLQCHVGGGLSLGGGTVSCPYSWQSGEFPMLVQEDSSSVTGRTVGIPAGHLVKLIPWWHWAAASFLMPPPQREREKRL